MNGVQLYQGDCLDVLCGMDAESVDLTVTSPPYDNLREYKGYSFDFEGIAQELARVTKPGGVIVWVVGDATIKGSETGTSFRQALYFKDVCGLNLHDTMIWQPSGVGAKGSHYSYWQGFEFMFVLSKGRPKTVNRIRDRLAKRAGTTLRLTRENTSSRHRKTHTTVARTGVRTNVWQYATGSIRWDLHENGWHHPAAFPEQLARDHIVSWSNPGDVVLDPMMGSGTTGKMAILEGRNFIGIEIAAEYYAIAQERIQNAQEAAQQLELPLAAGAT